MWKIILCCTFIPISVFASFSIDSQLFPDARKAADNLLAYTVSPGLLSQTILYTSIDEPQKLRLLDDVKTGQSQAGLGTLLYFSGLIMKGAGIPLMMRDIKYRPDSDDFPAHWLALSLAGVGLSLAGPISSLSGANRIEASMEEVYDDFYKHSYTNLYIKSIVFESVAWMINITGTSLLQRDGARIGNILVDVISYGLMISAEAIRGKSVLGPLVYGKRAKKHTVKRTSALRLSPAISFNGGFGFRCHMIF